MRNSHTRVAFALAAAVALTACGGGAGAPIAAPAQFGSAARASDGAKTPNISGEYAGTVKDNNYGKGRMTASLAQYQSAIGGSMTIAAGTSSITSADAWTLSNSTDLTGRGAAPVGTAVCVYSTAGSYDAKTHRLSGSYHAINGCSGQSGTFTLKQKCFYARHGAQADVGGLKMC